MKQMIYAGAGLIAFLLMIGSVGSMDQELIGIGQGVFQCLLFMVLWIFFTYRAKAFYWQTEEEE